MLQLITKTFLYLGYHFYESQNLQGKVFLFAPNIGMQFHECACPTDDYFGRQYPKVVPQLVEKHQYFQSEKVTYILQCNISVFMHHTIHAETRAYLWASNLAVLENQTIHTVPVLTIIFQRTYIEILK